ncbi:MAG: hypothetical protein DI570_30475, partial [Phenylobacterium zucineum]
MSAVRKLEVDLVGEIPLVVPPYEAQSVQLRAKVAGLHALAAIGERDEVRKQAILIERRLGVTVEERVAAMQADAGEPWQGRLEAVLAEVVGVADAKVSVSRPRRPVRARAGLPLSGSQRRRMREADVMEASGDRIRAFATRRAVMREVAEADELREMAAAIAERLAITGRSAADEADDGLEMLFDAGRITPGQYSAGRAVRVLVEARGHSLKSGLNVSDGGGACQNRAVEAGFTVALATTDLKAVEDAVRALKGGDRKWAILIAIAGVGVTLRAFVGSGGRNNRIALVRFCTALETAYAVLGPTRI